MDTRDINNGEDYFALDAFAQKLGVQLVSVAPGEAHVRLPTLKEWAKNGVGTTHGGVIFALADIAFATACHWDGRAAIGIQASITYLNPSGEGPIDARALEISRSRKLTTYEVRVLGVDGQLIATFLGTAYLR